MCEKEAPCCTDVQLEKVAPALSVPVGDSVSCVLGVDAVVLGDGGVSSGAVGRYLSVGDVSCGGDMELCGVDTVVASTVSGGMCDLERVSGGGDTDVSGVDTLVSGAVSGCMCTLTVCHQMPYLCVLVRCRCQEVVMQSCRVLMSLGVAFAR